MTPHDWTARLGAACRANGVPGAVLGLWHGGAAQVIAAGVADLGTRAAVTPATIFRLGSVTKLLTACLALQQVAAGRLDLDDGVDRCVPEVAANGAGVGAATLQQLLSHTSGVFGDILDSPSDGDDALAAYAAAADRLEAITPPGRAFSYCNAGFALAARATEVAAGTPWQTLLTDRLLVPAGMMRSGTDWAAWPDRDVAACHVDTPSGLAPVRDELPLRAMAPAGATAWTTAGDMLALARLLLADGRTADGREVLTAAACDALRALAIAGPTPTFATGWGLGTQRFTADGGTWGHDGAVAGQNSFLRLVRSEGAALVLFANGGDARGLFHDVFAAFEGELGRRAADPVPDWPAAPAAVDPSPYTGTYAVARYAVRVTGAGDGLDAVFTPAPDAGDFTAPFEVKLLAQPGDSTAELFLTRMAGARLPTQQRFMTIDGSRFLLFRGRLLPRVA